MHLLFMLEPELFNVREILTRILVFIVKMATSMLCFHYEMIDEPVSHKVMPSVHVGRVGSDLK